MELTVTEGKPPPGTVPSKRNHTPPNCSHDQNGLSSLRLQKNLRSRFHSSKSIRPKQRRQIPPDALLFSGKASQVVRGCRSERQLTLQVKGMIHRGIEVLSFISLHLNGQ